MMEKHETTKQSCKNCVRRRYYCPYAHKIEVYYGNFICGYYIKETEYKRYNSTTGKFDTIKGDVR